jgi:hypothetical protein
VKKIIAVTGHYGVGKTYVAAGLAKKLVRTGMPVTIVDLDIVNPYFRTADARTSLEKIGVKVIAPLYAGTNLDIPAINFGFEEIISGGISHGGYVIIDVGGDDSGALALGRYKTVLDGYADELSLLYVINCYRFLTLTPEDAVNYLREIELASRLKVTGIVNNSNLGSETAAADIENSAAFARKVSELTGLPIVENVFL